MKTLSFPFRCLLAGLFCLVATGGHVALAAESYVPAQRMKVVIDNDFCGDPDGLFRLHAGSKLAEERKPVSVL